MLFKIFGSSADFDAASGDVTFHFDMLGIHRYCRVSSTALLFLGAGNINSPLSIFNEHQLRIAQRAFNYFSLYPDQTSVTLRAIDF